MHIIDVIEETYSALTVNKVRTGLTMLGIIIGIASVISMISIGQGAQTSIQSSIQSIGSNLIQIQPGAQRTPGVQVNTGRGAAKTLKSEDATAIATSITGVKAVAPDLSSRYQVTAKGTNTNTSVDGVTADYLTVRNMQVDLGTFITDQNNKAYSKVAVLGSSVRDDLFGEGVDPTGQVIRINGMEFKVTGVMKAKGGSGFGSQDDMIFIPLVTAQKFLVGSDYVSTISVQAESADVMTQMQSDITDLLLTRHKIKTGAAADFNVMNQSDIVATASSVTSTFTILLAAVAGISLVVGGIGIMNMMLTTVTERTREIGLRKAIGAKRRDISLQFLIEAVAMTFIGGIIGVALGWGVGYIVTYLNIVQTSISLYSVLLAFGVSAGIGIIFGYYPARRASKLNPIEALRFE
jgi:putative ABC transport system permease protein